ncbi:hypothetical protein [Gordonia sp. (in: high G+C Gram-positive bacteria)]|uniref:hypothetical protein n=1 Tax=Gordonia sp. (in: high G+C Gram-positive bacteria) TaxID=84139 RepID=UPI003F9C12B7
MKNYVRNALVIGVASAGLVLAGCSTSSDGEKQTTASTASDATVTTQADEDETYVSKIEEHDKPFTLGNYIFTSFSQASNNTHKTDCKPEYCMRVGVREKSGKTLDENEVKTLLATNTVTVPLDFHRACNGETKASAEKAIAMLNPASPAIITDDPERNSTDASTKADAMSRAVVYISINEGDKLSSLALLNGDDASKACVPLSVANESKTISAVPSQLPLF